MRISPYHQLFFHENLRIHHDTERSDLHKAQHQLSSLTFNYYQNSLLMWLYQNMRIKIKFQTTEKLRQCFTRHRTTSSYSQWSKLQSHVDVAVRTVLWYLKDKWYYYSRCYPSGVWVRLSVPWTRRTFPNDSQGYSAYNPNITNP